jgi:hypothetical protein
MRRCVANETERGSFVEAELDGVSELSRADDFVTLCKLGHPLDECEGMLSEIGDVHRVDIQCRMCQTVFVFRSETEPSSASEWRLVESSDPLIGENCVSKRMRIAMAEERRRVGFHAHWQDFASRSR